MSPIWLVRILRLSIIPEPLIAAMDGGIQSEKLLMQ
jgi:hypothetical protein